MPTPTRPHRHAIRDGLRILRTKLGLKSSEATVLAGPDKTLEPAPAPSTAETSPIDEVLAADLARAQSRAMYGNVGLHDATRAGWFNRAKRELFTDFPVLPTDTVLDVGCGLGGNLRFCAEMASRVIGIDIDPEKVQATQKMLLETGCQNFEVIEGDGNPLPLPSESIDKIICTEVIEHVDDPMVTLRELMRVGKPGALYLLSVPGQRSEELIKSVAPAYWFEKPNHIRILSADDFKRLVEDTGLIIERHEFVSFYWVIWHALLCLCQVDHHEGTHPALDHWAKAWDVILADPITKQRISALDQVLHKSQIIIARKPA